MHWSYCSLTLAHPYGDIMVYFIDGAPAGMILTHLIWALFQVKVYFGSAWIFLGMDSADQRQYIISHWLSLYPEWSLFRKWQQQTIARANVDPYLCCQLASLGHNELTHWRWDRMACIWQKTFSSAFPWMKTFWILNTVSTKYVPLGLIDSVAAWLGVEQATSHYLNNDDHHDLVYLCIYLSLGMSLVNETLSSIILMDLVVQIMACLE